MTPERQKWWDSLPSYEKQARNAIKESKRKIKWAKEELPHSFGPYGEAMKDGLRRNKFLIKALRKQIGLCPIGRASRNDPTGSCPTCNDLVIRREHDCCAGCGQKLRWE